MSAFKKTVFLLISIAIVLLDQWSKYLARVHLIPGVPYKLTSWLNFTLGFNRGAAFSFLSSQSGWQLYVLSAVSLIAAIIFITWLYKLKLGEGFKAVAIALIIGGALGNFIDRAFIHRVTDFIDFHIQAWHYATFNVADAAVSVGVVLLILDAIFRKPHTNT